MPHLIPLQIEKIESDEAPVIHSPFPELSTASAAPVGVTAAEIVGVQENVETRRMEQLEKMLQEAQGRTESVEREAYDKAYSAGEKAGLALGEKRAEQILGVMNECLKQAESEASHMRQNCVDAVVDIARLVVEQLMGDMLKQQEDTLLKAAKRAAEQLPDASELKLAIHPDDMQSFERLLDKEASDWRWYADSSIARGTCRLVSTHQDALIDPIQAIAESIEHIRMTLHAGAVHPDADGKDPDYSAES